MVARTRIPLTRPETDDDEARAVAEVLGTGHLTQGPKVSEFERLIGDLVGARHAIATTSATTALHLAIAALDIGPDDEVLVPDFTFPATANVVVQQGARPVLVDIDPATFSVDVADLERRITPRTRAVMPVHPFGLSADMDRVMSIAREHRLAVVEDAACALGATYHGRPVGAIGKAGCFSFHPRKSITTGEGGMVVTDDDELADRLRLLRSHGGRRTGNRFTFELAGYNYRLSDILAAVGVAQLKKLDRLLERRRALANRYRELLAGNAAVGLPTEPAWGGHVYQSFVILVGDGINRDSVIAQLDEAGIETTLGTYALHREPFFTSTYGYRPGELPASDSAYRRSITLPLYPSMATDDQDYVVDRLQAILAAA